MASRASLVSSRYWSSIRLNHVTKRLSSTNTREPLRFTYALPTGSEIEYRKLFDSIRQKPFLKNPSRHDAAVLLATPQLARQILDDIFMTDFASLMKADAKLDSFHILAAIVDHVASPLGTYEQHHGVSVLRGRLDDIIPQLWLPSPTRSKEDADAVAALTFDLGRPSLTLPLTRTTFQNHRTSTLLASQIDMEGDSPRITKQVEKFSQHVNLSGVGDTAAGLSIQAPLVPLTQSRVVTNSFGNIVKGLELDAQPVPASTELEHAVNTAFELLPQSTSGPVGVWALVTPETADDDVVFDGAPDPMPFLEGQQSINDVAAISTDYVKKMYGQGARLYQILSGGGGWGAKKGLLSLDPQRRHFSLSEEEELQRFMQSMETSSFAPPGSRIQFFSALAAPTNTPESPSSDLIFGVPGSAPHTKNQGTDSSSLELHFGALSGEGVYLLDLSEADSSTADESRLSVPHSRVAVGAASTQKGGLLDTLADGLTLAGRDSL